MLIYKLAPATIEARSEHSQDFLVQGIVVEIFGRNMCIILRSPID